MDKSILVVGGYGVVGAQFCQMFHERNPGVKLLIAGRSMEKAVEASKSFAGAQGIRLDVTDADPISGIGTTPDAILVAVNDHHDNLLRSAIRRGIAIADIARWTSRLEDAAKIATEMNTATPIILSSGWMAGAVAVAINALRRPGETFRQIDIDVLFYGADNTGPDSTAGFIDVHMPFEIFENGKVRTVTGLSDPRWQVFPSGKSAQVRRFSAPDQKTLVQTGITAGVAAHMAFDSAAMTAFFAAIVRWGIWRRLSRTTRNKLLYNPGAGAPHEIVVTVDNDHSRRRIVMVDPLGQTHFTAAGAVLQAERLLGLQQRIPLAAGLNFPEQASDPEVDLATLRSLGVELDWETDGTE
jgi:saccharopine dehydrogenase-like NADP-dependent oxidoreductase